MSSVTLMDILDARDRRAQRQQQLLAAYGCPLLSFTMNIPGPVKNSPLIRRGFYLGMERLQAALKGAGLSTLPGGVGRAHRLRVFVRYSRGSPNHQGSV